MSADRQLFLPVSSQRHSQMLLIGYVCVAAMAIQFGRWGEAEILKLTEIAVGALSMHERPLSGNESASVPDLSRVMVGASAKGGASQTVEAQKTTSIIASASLDISAAGEIHWLSEQWQALMREFGF